MLEELVLSWEGQPEVLTGSSKERAEDLEQQRVLTTHSVTTHTLRHTHLFFCVGQHLYSASPPEVKCTGLTSPPGTCQQGRGKLGQKKNTFTSVLEETTFKKVLPNLCERDEHNAAPPNCEPR